MPQTAAQDATRAARLFHALADETCLKIVEFFSRGEPCVCDLTDALKTGQSRLSCHLKILKEAGLIGDRREGWWNDWALAPEAFDEVAKLVGAMKDGTKLFTKPSCRCGYSPCCRHHQRLLLDERPHILRGEVSAFVRDAHTDGARTDQAKLGWG